MPTKVGSVFCSLSRTSGSRKNCQESSSIGGQNRANLLPSSTSKKCRCQFFPSHRSSKFLPRVKVNGPFVFLLFSIIALNTITLAEQEHATNDETPEQKNANKRSYGIDLHYKAVPRQIDSLRVNTTRKGESENNPNLLGDGHPHSLHTLSNSTSAASTTEKRPIERSASGQYQHPIQPYEDIIFDTLPPSSEPLPPSPAPALAYIGTHGGEMPHGKNVSHLILKMPTRAKPVPPAETSTATTNLIGSKTPDKKPKETENMPSTATPMEVTEKSVQLTKTMPTANYPEPRTEEAALERSKQTTIGQRRLDEYWQSNLYSQKGNKQHRIGAKNDTNTAAQSLPSPNYDSDAKPVEILENVLTRTTETTTPENLAKIKEMPRIRQKVWYFVMVPTRSKPIKASTMPPPKINEVSASRSPDLQLMTTTKTPKAPSEVVKKFHRDEYSDHSSVLLPPIANPPSISPSVPSETTSISAIDKAQTQTRQPVNNGKDDGKLVNNNSAQKNETRTMNNVDVDGGGAPPFNFNIDGVVDYIYASVPGGNQNKQNVKNYTRQNRIGNSEGQRQLDGSEKKITEESERQNQRIRQYARQKPARENLAHPGKAIDNRNEIYAIVGGRDGQGKFEIMQPALLENSTTSQNTAHNSNRTSSANEAESESIAKDNKAATNAERTHQQAKHGSDDSEKEQRVQKQLSSAGAYDEIAAPKNGKEMQQNGLLLERTNNVIEMTTSHFTEPSPPGIRPTTEASMSVKDQKQEEQKSPSNSLNAKNLHVEITTVRALTIEDKPRELETKNHSKLAEENSAIDNQYGGLIQKDEVASTQQRNEQGVKTDEAEKLKFDSEGSARQKVLLKIELNANETINNETMDDKERLTQVKPSPQVQEVEGHHAHDMNNNDIEKEMKCNEMVNACISAIAATLATSETTTPFSTEKESAGTDVHIIGEKSAAKKKNHFEELKEEIVIQHDAKNVDAEHYQLHQKHYDEAGEAFVPFVGDIGKEQNESVQVQKEPENNAKNSGSSESVVATSTPGNKHEVKISSNKYQNVSETNNTTRTVVEYANESEGQKENQPGNRNLSPIIGHSAPNTSTVNNKTEDKIAEGKQSNDKTKTNHTNALENELETSDTKLKATTTKIVSEMDGNWSTTMFPTSLVPINTTNGTGEETSKHDVHIPPQRDEQRNAARGLIHASDEENSKQHHFEEQQLTTRESMDEAGVTFSITTTAGYGDEDVPFLGPTTTEEELTTVTSSHIAKDSKPAVRNDYDHEFTEVPATAKMTSSDGDQIGSTADTTDSSTKAVKTAENITTLTTKTIANQEGQTTGDFTRMLALLQLDDVLGTAGPVFATDAEQQVVKKNSSATIMKEGGNETIETSENISLTSAPIEKEKKMLQMSPFLKHFVIKTKKVEQPTERPNIWRPYQMNCDEEVDDKGPELCREWARGGLCMTNRATQFLFCRRTCLCVGPPPSDATLISAVVASINNREQQF